MRKKREKKKAKSLYPKDPNAHLPWGEGTAETCKSKKKRKMKKEKGTKKKKKKQKENDRKKGERPHSQKKRKKKKKEEENKGRPRNPTPLTYPRKEPKPGSSPPCFQNKNEEGSAHWH